MINVSRNIMAIRQLTADADQPVTKCFDQRINMYSRRDCHRACVISHCDEEADVENRAILTSALASRPGRFTPVRT
jgi:hypothetical protein